MRLPKKWVYCDGYKSKNYGAHCIAIDIPGVITLWFSYDTVVAFQAPNHEMQVRENGWGPTTGSHLNCLCYPKARIPGDLFEAELFKQLEGIAITLPSDPEPVMERRRVVDHRLAERIGAGVPACAAKEET